VGAVLFGIADYCRLPVEAFARPLKSSASLTQWSRSPFVLRASAAMWTSPGIPDLS